MALFALLETCSKEPDVECTETARRTSKVEPARRKRRNIRRVEVGRDRREEGEREGQVEEGSIFCREMEERQTKGRAACDYVVAPNDGKSSWLPSPSVANCWHAARLAKVPLFSRRVKGRYRSD